MGEGVVIFVVVAIVANGRNIALGLRNRCGRFGLGFGARHKVEYRRRLKPAMLATRAAHGASIGADGAVGHEISRSAFGAFEDHRGASRERP
jgi:hypothetical protein